MDVARLRLLVVPASLLVAAYGAGVVVDRACGGHIRTADTLPLGGLAVRIGTGLACVSLLAVVSAMGGFFWLSGIAVLAFLGVGAIRLARSGFSRRFGCVSLPCTVSGCVVGVAWLVAWLWATTPPVFYDELV